MPAYLQTALTRLREQGLWLLRCSRTGGPLGREMPGAQSGSATPWLFADDQNAPRARLLLALALSEGLDGADELQALFYRY